MSRVSSWWRGAVLVVTLLFGLAAFYWWRASFHTGCHFWNRRDGTPVPFELDETMAKALLPPVVLFFAGAYIALGAKQVRWRMIGLAMSFGALGIGWFIGLDTFEGCT